MRWKTWSIVNRSRVKMMTSDMQKKAKKALLLLSGADGYEGEWVCLIWQKEEEEEVVLVGDSK